MENKNSNESREMTQEELDKIVGGYISSRPNIQQQRMPGLACPRCGNFIPTSIKQILYSSALFCPTCGLSLNIDKRKSETALRRITELEKESRRIL